MFNKSLKSASSKIDIIISIILILSISMIVISIAYVINNPIEGEKFTEFYLLGPNRKTDRYPKDLKSGEKSKVTLGIINHEGHIIDYTVEIWLIKQTTIDNNSLNNNNISYESAWFMDKINISLSSIDVNTDSPWEPQWEYEYTFNITKKGENFKLLFLLFTKPTKSYNRNTDYKDIIQLNIRNSYEDLYLWINIY